MGGKAKEGAIPGCTPNLGAQPGLVVAVDCTYDYINSGNMPKWDGTAFQNFPLFVCNICGGYLNLYSELTSSAPGWTASGRMARTQQLSAPVNTRF